MGHLSAVETAELERFENGEKHSGIDYRNLIQQDVVRILKVTAATISSWVSKGCPCKKVGNRKVYDCGDILTCRIEYQKELDGIDAELAGPNNSDAMQEYRLLKQSQLVMTWTSKGKVHRC